MKNLTGKCWRDSASLILLSKQNNSVPSKSLDRDSVNYDILLQKRTSRGSFANAVVFPGGVCEDVDASDRWLHHFKTFDFSQAQFDALHKVGTPVTSVFHKDPIRSHISLRITAIRETFEELGILLCSSKYTEDYNWANVLSGIDVKQWQAKISKNPGELLTLCKELNCYPDIWNLHYWSDWLTPVTFPKRFYSVFFVAGLKSRPEVSSSEEVVTAQWESPTVALEKHRKKRIVLFPPQVYELHRLSKTKDIEKLLDFAKKRSSLGNDLYYPIIVKAKDGYLHLLPGDDLYPSSINLENDVVIDLKDKSIEELRKNSTILHRFEGQEDKKLFIVQNFESKYHINMNGSVLNFQ